MRRRERPLARAGIFGSKEQPQIVTDRDLQEIYESFQSMNSAPIILEHDFSGDAPRFGQVVALSLSDGILRGVVEEHDVLAACCDEGFYPDLSIGAKTSAETGKKYLHHLKYCGEESPAIKNLRTAVTTSLAAIAASDRREAVYLPPYNAQALSLSDNNQSLGGTTMDEIAELKSKVEALTKKNAELTNQLAKADSGTQPEVAALKEENEALKAKLKALAEKHPDEAIGLSDSDPRIAAFSRELRKSKTDMLMSAAKGKVPAAQLPLVEAIAGSLALSDTIALSDGKKTSSFEALRDVFAALPDQGLNRELIALSEPVSGTETKGQESPSRRIMRNL